MADADPRDIATLPPEMTILADHPARAETSSPDLLGLESRLSAVFDILRHKNTSCPITIAVYGDWGTGKTSAMRWLETKLCIWNALPGNERKEHPRVHPVWFDPWRYHTREEVWRGIIAEVILALFHIKGVESGKLAAGLRGAAKRFGSFLGRGFLHALSHIEIEAGSEHIAKAKFSGEMFQDIYDEFAKANEPEKAHLNQFEETLRQWLKDFLPDGDRLVLFIDDLDRCLPAVTLEVLEAIKLYLNLPQLLFVVGLDRAVVDAVVAKHYADSGLDGTKSRHYLNKLFQVEVQIPPSEQQMGAFFNGQLHALDVATSGYWRDMLSNEDHRRMIEDGIRQLARHNPREIKRLLNSALMRGRAATANTALPDDPAFSPDDNRRLRFAQGVQVYLLQHHVHNRLSAAQNLLLTTTNLQWFADASDFRARYPQFDLGETSKDGLAKRYGMTATIPKHSPEDVAFGKLLEHPPLDDLGKPVDPVFLTDPLLWSLLAAPFSIAVAQSAPKPDTRRSPLPTTGQGLEKTFAEMPAELRDRVALELDKPVDQFTAVDLAGLRKLDLSGTNVKGAGLREVARLTALQSLSLRGTNVTDVDLKELAKLTALESLDLRGTKVTDAGLKEVALLTALQSLTLWATRVTDVGLKELTQLTALQSLNLRVTRVTDAGLKEVTRFRALRKLDLLGTRVTDAGLKDVAQLAALQELDLASTAVTDAGLKEVAKLSALQSLDLMGTAVTDAGLKEVAKLSALQSLNLINTKVTDAGLPDMARLTALQSLMLLGTRVTEEGAAKLKHSLPGLRIGR